MPSKHRVKHSYNPLVRCHGVTRAIAIRPETEKRGPSAISLCAVPLAPGGYLRGDLAGLVFISVYFLFFFLKVGRRAHLLWWRWWRWGGGYEFGARGASSLRNRTRAGSERGEAGTGALITFLRFARNCIGGKLPSLILAL